MSRILPFLLFALVLTLMIWLSSGTMAPYASSHHKPLVKEPCNYLVNLDHPRFEGPVKFLDGADVSEWRNNIMLRRMLYPTLAYPFMQIWGFELGGFLANIFIHLIVFAVFIHFIYQQFGRLSALSLAALLSTYPGIAYWSGLPYAYALIVPCSLLGMILLWKIAEHSSWKSCLLSALGLGVLSTGYDLLPYFGSATLLILLSKRRFLQILPALLLIFIPLLTVVYMFKYVYGVSPQNHNSEVYQIIITSYFNPPPIGEWWQVISEIPALFLHNFVYSNFLFFPLLFILALIIGIGFMRERLHIVEISLALAVLAVFLFNNAAPPYEYRWQIRGEWIARIYQPVFVVYLLYVARLISISKEGSRTRKSLVAILLLVTLANISISFGPILKSPLAWHAYHNFYQHSRPSAFPRNLKKYGSRPIGFCKSNISS